MDIVRVFVGFDERETVALNVLNHSINMRAKRPVSVCPVNLKHLDGIYTREVNPLQSSDFSFSRFLVPYLCNFEGWALFIDCDMIMQRDVGELWDLRDDKYAVMCVKHDHRPKEEKKFLGHIQTKYEKKNWSSVMLLNNERCKSLTPDYVNNASGLELHQFKWLESEGLIGEVPQRWNHLAGYNEYDPDAALIHFTKGGPYFEEFRECEYSERWFAEHWSSQYCKEK